MDAQTNNIQGILISSADVGTISSRTDEICSWANSHHAANMQEEIKLTKAYCLSMRELEN